MFEIFRFETDLFLIDNYLLSAVSYSTNKTIYVRYDRQFNLEKSLPIADNCSSLFHCNFDGGVIPRKSSHCSPSHFTPTEHNAHSCLHQITPPPNKTP